MPLPASFFDVTPPGAALGTPVKTGAHVRRFRGCNIRQVSWLKNDQRATYAFPLLDQAGLRAMNVQTSLNQADSQNSRFQTRGPPFYLLHTRRRRTNQRMTTQRRPRCASSSLRTCDQSASDKLPSAAQERWNAGSSFAAGCERREWHGTLLRGTSQVPARAADPGR